MFLLTSTFTNEINSKRQTFESLQTSDIQPPDMFFGAQTFEMQCLRAFDTFDVSHSNSFSFVFIAVASTAIKTEVLQNSKMSFSKPTSKGSKKRTLTLEEKVKFLDFKQKNPAIGCRRLAKMFEIDIGKTQASENAASIRKDYKFFVEGNQQRQRKGKYQAINVALYRWYKKCESSGIFPNGPMCMEEAMLIKEAMGTDLWILSDKWLVRKVETFLRN